MWSSAEAAGADVVKEAAEAGAGMRIAGLRRQISSALGQRG
jgi:hypothetical protein